MRGGRASAGYGLRLRTPLNMAPYFNIPPGMRADVVWPERSLELGPGAHVLA
jgi:hypothetical protein